MRDDLPPAGKYKAGQDFQAQRQKARAGSLTSGAGRADGGRGGGPTAQTLYGSRAPAQVRTSIESKDISREQASNQDKYGANREAIRGIIRNWGK